MLQSRSVASRSFDFTAEACWGCGRAGWVDASCTSYRLHRFSPVTPWGTAPPLQGLQVVNRSTAVPTCARISPWQPQRSVCWVRARRDVQQELGLLQAPGTRTASPPTRRCASAHTPRAVQPPCCVCQCHSGAASTCPARRRGARGAAAPAPTRLAAGGARRLTATPAQRSAPWRPSPPLTP